MTYLVAQIWGWLLVALVLGIAAGWLWARIAAARRLEEPIGEWRMRAAALERERDQLRVELGGYRDRATPPTPEVALPIEATDAASDPGGEPMSSGPEATVETAPDQPLAASAADDGTQQPIAPDPVTPAADTAPALAEPVPVPVDTTARDDLTRIKGIGRALENRLNGLGITRYAQIAQLDQDGIRRIDEALGFRGRVVRDRWIEQAATLLASAEPEPPPA